MFNEHYLRISDKTLPLLMHTHDFAIEVGFHGAQDGPYPRLPSNLPILPKCWSYASCAGLFHVDLTQARVLWEAGTSVEKSPPQIDPWASLWGMF